MSAELHSKLLTFIAGEFQRTENRQCTEVELTFAPGSGYKEELLRKWVRKEDPELFEPHKMADMVSMAVDIAESEADAKQPGKHRFVLRTRQFCGTQLPCAFAIQPTYNGGDDQAMVSTGGGGRGDGAVIAAHAGQLMRTNAAMFDGILRAMGQQIQDARNENSEIRAESVEYRNRIKELERELDRLQTNRHEREIETIKVTEREKRRSAMAAKFFSDFAPVIMAKLTGGKLPMTATPGSRRDREKVLDQLLKSLSSDDSRLEVLAKLLQPKELDMLSALSADIEDDEPPPQTASSTTQAKAPPQAQP